MFGRTHIRMTNFPTRTHWFDSTLLATDRKDGDRILVSVQKHSDLDGLSEIVAEHPKQTFLLVAENFDIFNAALPPLWLRMPPDGGIPKNVWVGAAVHTQQEADERMRRLVRIRARKLFIMLKKGHDQRIDLSMGLIAWRCSNCGRKDGYGRLKRPEECPTGMLCKDKSEIDPQIHGVMSMDPHKSSKLAELCAKRGVAFWDNQSLEVPE